VATIREFARTVDIRLVAEGVESVNELRVLRQVGVKLAQGYLFARPHETVREPDLLILESEEAGPEGDEEEDAPGRAKIGS
jgi:EAL domain-containing protein (putative c-di-GMP-specific phosphodiesterase class I)